MPELLITSSIDTIKQGEVFYKDLLFEKLPESRAKQARRIWELEA